ncbi:chromate transporter [Sulfuriferula plumbiphila]|uniref:Chromate transporter n=1 Tax=Sulfuriferula plumbiphila TaxID=171865 RepID=A0A512LCM1_9PROT|nr:chromate efflux transporter [Sulfuriferula plumbiphila]BBP04693.1 chromate transporter [Sulfuriferula plumbiphila]GEP31881.1 chromate transporter [Sulfuriferula plumbiphila]
MVLDSQATQAEQRTSLLDIFLIFLKLGCTSFGGPIAHLGYFRAEFVERRKWLNDHAYADLVALCQFLPGPASSQAGIALGLFRGGLPGALASWLGFTLPSAIALVLFGLVLTNLGSGTDGAWLHGLKVVAVAVVAQALWSMGKSLCPDRLRASIAVAGAVVAFWIPGVLGEIGVIVFGGLVGWLWLAPPASELPHSPFPLLLRKRTGAVVLLAFFVLLLLLPAVAAQTDSYAIHLFDSFFRAGSLVFGGGHVVLPVLQSQVVPAGWVSNDAFLAGYGAAQAVPGPLFTFAAYLGAVSSQSPHGWLGAAVALVAIFLPAFMLVIGALPLWEGARRHPAMQRAMLGVNAAVVGLLLAAFYQPVWTSAILSPADFSLAAGAFLLLVFWKTPPWLVVILCALLAGLGWH